MHYEYRQTTFTGKYELTEEEALASPFQWSIERRQVGDWERLAPPPTSKPKRSSPRG